MIIIKTPSKTGWGLKELIYFFLAAFFRRLTAGFVVADIALDAVERLFVVRAFFLVVVFFAAVFLRFTGI